MEKFKAKWEPHYHALDPRIRKGAADKFLFTREDERWFYAGGGHPGDADAIYAQILSIHHKHLGDIDEIDTHGLSYKIWLNEFDLIQVDAEGNLGSIERSTLKELPVINDFIFEIQLETAYVSQPRELEMIPVMLDDDAGEFYKWWGNALEDVEQPAVVVGALVHYIKHLLRTNDPQLNNVFRFIDRMYSWGNPYISTMFDNELMMDLINVNGAGEWIKKFEGGDMQKQFSLFSKRQQIHHDLWK